jgi:ribosome biogenesis GTPase
MQLESIGYSSCFEQAFRDVASPGLVPGRVAAEHTHVYRVFVEAGELLAEVAGRLRHEARGPQDFPAVGDWVAIAARSDEGRGTIHAVLARRSAFVRRAAGNRPDAQVLAANVDTVFLVAGLDGDFNPRRVERALLLAFESGATPVIVLNKSDLATDLEQRRREMEAASGGVPVVALSARRGDGIDGLAPYLVAGRTVALIGSSGVGKSTLVNRLVGGEALRTSEVRAHDQRGRHTTTHRELVPLPGGAVLLDTPGLREIQLWAGDESLATVFSDVESLAVGCRFRDCRHEGEPGCAVAAAIAEGSLDEDRLTSHRKLERELAFRRRLGDAGLQAAEKARWKAIHRAHRKNQKRT